MSNTDAFAKRLLEVLTGDVEAVPGAGLLAFINTEARYEGTRARFNPFSCSNPAPRSTRYNAASVQNYYDVNTAAIATAANLRYQPAYRPLVAAIRANGAPASFVTAEIADALDVWGTHDLADAMRKSGFALTDDYVAPSMEYPDPEAPVEAPPAEQFPIPANSLIVKPGDTLYSIAEREYGDGEMYPLLFNANREVIAEAAEQHEVPDNGDFIFPGTRLVIPAKPVDVAHASVSDVVAAGVGVDPKTSEADDPAARREE